MPFTRNEFESNKQTDESSHKDDTFTYDDCRLTAGNTADDTADATANDTAADTATATSTITLLGQFNTNVPYDHISDYESNDQSDPDDCEGCGRPFEDGYEHGYNDQSDHAYDATSDHGYDDQSDHDDREGYSHMFDNDYDHKSDDKSDQGSDDKSDHDSDDQSDHDSDDKSDHDDHDKSDHDSDDQSDHDEREGYSHPFDNDYDHKSDDQSDQDDREVDDRPSQDDDDHESDQQLDKRGQLEQKNLKQKSSLVSNNVNNIILKPSVALVSETNENELNFKASSDLDSKQSSDSSKTENTALIQNPSNKTNQNTKKPTLIPNPKYFFVPSLTVEQITNLVQIPPPKKEYKRVFYRPGHPRRTSRIYLQNVMTEAMLQKQVEFREKKEEDDKKALLKIRDIKNKRIWLYSVLTFMVTRNTAPEATNQKLWTKFTFFVLLKLRYITAYLDVRYGFDLKRNPLWLVCTNCNQIIFEKLARRKNSMCYLCKHYIKMSSRDRRNHLLDGNTWVPMNDLLAPEDKLHFMDNMPFIERIAKYQQDTGLIDAVETGLGFIDNMPVALGVMEFNYMGGSMGSAVGEKIARLIRYSTRHGLPVILVTASGGARMQEGAISLAQMSKISGTLYYHQRCAHYMSLSVLTSPTTGGVTASFGMLGDVVIAEPLATIAFAGRRVIEQTLGIVLPPHFQTAEHLYQQGLVDLVIDRPFLRCVLIILLRINFDTANRVFKPGPGKILDLTRILEAPSPVLTPVLCD